MSKSVRDIPKTIAAFGEKQFKETGAAAVEVLRVKAVVMRKHFRQLKGIVYLVAVISLDRVRVYFFNAAGVMVIGENLDSSIYTTVRKSSKLIAKFEKPKILTQEELRIEATQELRDNFGKAIRRVSRFLAAKEPSFPDIFVTRTKNEKPTQNFGLQISPDFEFIFEENVLSQQWTEGILVRCAFLLHLDEQHWSNENACAIGNSLAHILLKQPIRDYWTQIWKKQCKGTIWNAGVTHFQEHEETYDSNVYNWFISALRGSKPDVSPVSWIQALAKIHDSVVVPIGTSEYQTINGFCKSLEKPNQLMKRSHLLESIHLSPRVFCNSASLGERIGISLDDKAQENPWASIQILDGAHAQILTIGTQNHEPIDAMEYWLNLEDVYPSTTGPLSHGLDIVRRALEKLGIASNPVNTFQARLDMNVDISLETKEIAVLERLLMGSLDIISNTLVGSPHIIKRLLEKECIVFVPDFNHLGIEPDFVVHGLYDDVKRISDSTLEYTLFKCNSNAYAMVSAPTSWRKPLLESAFDSNLDIWPILSTKSERRLLRHERIFIEGKELHRWSDGTS